MKNNFLIFFSIVFLGVVLTPTTPSPSLSLWGFTPVGQKLTLLTN